MLSGATNHDDANSQLASHMDSDRGGDSGQDERKADVLPDLAGKGQEEGSLAPFPLRDDDDDISLGDTLGQAAQCKDLFGQVVCTPPPEVDSFFL